MNVQVVSDQKLLNCYLSGDRSAISQLIERHSRRVRDYIQMMVKDGDVADDIFQETFIKAVRVIDEPLYRQRTVSFVDPAHRAQSGDRLFPRPKTEPAAQRGRSRLRRTGYAATGRTHRRRRNRLRADRRRRPPSGGFAARGTTRSSDDALLFGSQFQGDRRTDRSQHQHGTGSYAIRFDQSSENDQGKKHDPKLERAQ